MRGIVKGVTWRSGLAERGRSQGCASEGFMWPQTFHPEMSTFPLPCLPSMRFSGGLQASVAEPVSQG